MPSKTIPRARAAVRSIARVRLRRADNESLSDAVCGALERAIVTGDLRPGAKLDEEALGHRLGASRTPVREALKALASRGLVELRARQGAFVAALDVAALIEMFETMALLESACAGLAARRHDAADRAALLAAAEQCRRSSARRDPRRFYADNARLHECIYRAAHNGYLERQTLALRDRLEAYRRETTFHEGLMAVSNAEHDRILAAILAMDEEGASREARRHLDTLRNDAVATFEGMARRAAA